MSGVVRSNALSIDLEEWYHAQLVQRHLGPGPRTSRVVEAVEPLLALLGRYEVRSTFFCVGEVLAQHPGLLRRIRELGHEIAFHGMTHRTLQELGPEGFEAEVEEFHRLAGDVLGPEVPIRGFRAPTFSLDRRTHWALPILARRGYLYDSSVFPMRGPLYGVPGAPQAPYPVALADPAGIDPDSPLTEVPPAVCRLGGVRIPVGGGVYLRVLPLSLLMRLLRRINAEQPFVLYVHPWETDPGTPRLPLPPLARLATYHGIRHTLGKLERLLQVFRFTTMAELVKNRTRRPDAVVEEERC